MLRSCQLKKIGQDKRSRAWERDNTVTKKKDKLFKFSTSLLAPPCSRWASLANDHNFVATSDAAPSYLLPAGLSTWSLLLTPGRLDPASSQLSLMLIHLH